MYITCRLSKEIDITWKWTAVNGSRNRVMLCPKASWSQPSARIDIAVLEEPFQQETNKQTKGLHQRALAPLLPPFVLFNSATSS
jgi:hypothetical protein